MNKNRELHGYVVFYPRRSSSFSQLNSRTHPCHVRINLPLILNKQLRMFTRDKALLNIYVLLQIGSIKLQGYLSACSNSLVTAITYTGGGLQTTYKFFYFIFMTQYLRDNKTWKWLSYSIYWEESSNLNLLMISSIIEDSGFDFCHILHYCKV